MSRARRAPPVTVSLAEWPTLATLGGLSSPSSCLSGVAFAEAVDEDRDRGGSGVSVRIRGDEEGCADDHRREPIVDETIRS